MCGPSCHRCDLGPCLPSPFSQGPLMSQVCDLGPSPQGPLIPQWWPLPLSGAPHVPGVALMIRVFAMLGPAVWMIPSPPHRLSPRWGPGLPLSLSLGKSLSVSLAVSGTLSLSHARARCGPFKREPRSRTPPARLRGPRGGAASRWAGLTPHSIGPDLGAVGKGAGPGERGLEFLDRCACAQKAGRSPLPFSNGGSAATCGECAPTCRPDIEREVTRRSQRTINTARGGGAIT